MSSIGKRLRSIPDLAQADQRDAVLSSDVSDGPESGSAHTKKHRFALLVNVLHPHTDQLWCEVEKQ